MLLKTRREARTAMTVQKSAFLIVLPWMRLSMRSRSGSFFAMLSNATANCELASKSSTASRLSFEQAPRQKASFSLSTFRSREDPGRLTGR